MPELTTEEPTTVAERGRPTTVARTMAEAGALCPACTHPFGRHEFVAGCAARWPTGRQCGCLARPGTEHGRDTAGWCIRSGCSRFGLPVVVRMSDRVYQCPPEHGDPVPGT